MIFTPGSSVSAYLRDSGGNRQELSVAQQEERIRAWCAENDLILSRIFADVAISGGSTAGREQMDAMLKYFEAGPPDAGVVFWDYSRWARNYDDGQYMLSLLRRRGYLVHSLEEYVPPGSTGKIVESLHLWSAEQYREQLSKNVKRGLNYIISNFHAYPRRRAPYGYHFVPIEIGLHRDGSPHILRRLEPDPETSPLVQKAFAMRAGGASAREIHKSVGFAYLSRQSYYYLFRNRIYIGIFDYGGQAYPNFCEPIIDPATWHAVRRIDDDWSAQRGAAHPRRATSQYLLTGLIRCSQCGTPMFGKTIRREAHVYRYYRCGKNARHQLEFTPCPVKPLKADEMDQLVFEAVKTHALDEAVLSQMYNEARARQVVLSDEHNAVLASARRELANLTAAIDRILSAIADIGHSRSLLEKLTGLEHERDKAQYRLIDLEAQAALPLPDLDIGELVREGLEILDHGNIRQQQLFLRAMVREIRVELVDGKPEGKIDLITPGGGGITVAI